MYDAFEDPYAYPGSNVLQNRTELAAGLAKKADIVTRLDERHDEDVDKTFRFLNKFVRECAVRLGWRQSLYSGSDLGRW